MHRTRRFPLIATLLALACSSPSDDRPPEVAEIRLDSENLEVVVGKPVKIEAQALDRFGREVRGALAFASPDPEIATVDSRGWVHGHSPGQTEVAITAGDREARVAVRVRRPVHRVEILPAEPVLLEDDTLQLEAEGLDIDGLRVEGDFAPRWRSDAPLVARVSETGEVRGIAPGLARIEVDLAEGHAEVQVEVRPRAHRITLRAARTELLVGEDVLVRVEVHDRRGEKLHDRPIAWSTSDSEVATVDAAGRVRALAPGECLVHAEADGVTSTLGIRVLPRVHTLEIAADLTAIYETGIARWTALAYDEAGNLLTDRNLVWTSSDPGVASVHSLNGTVVGIAPGEATIFVRADEAEAAATIRVHPRPLAEILSPADLREEPGHEVQLEYVFEADDPLPIEWRTSDPAVARPAEAGKVEIVGLGKATVTLASGGIELAFPVTGSLRFRSIAVGDDFACGITRRDRVWCWGNNAVGQLGSGAAGGSSHIPVRVALDSEAVPVTIAAGSHHACVLLDDGEAHCWGDNRSGELGTPADVPFSAVPVPAAPGSRFVALAAGHRPSVDTLDDEGAHTCGLTVDSRLLCWGNNRVGQLGDGSRQSTSLPVEPAGGHAFVRVAAGAGFTCAIDEEGALYCWGEGPLGTPLAINDRSMQRSDVPRIAHHSVPAAPPGPVPIPICGEKSEEWPNGTGIPYAEVSAGWRHACAITPDNRVFCWGANIGDALSNSGYDIHGICAGFLPVRAPSSPTVLVEVLVHLVSPGSTATCAIDPEGQAICWGRVFGSRGEFELCSQPNNHYPVALPVDERVLAVELGSAYCEDFACLLGESGIVRCHGYNLDGRAGQPASVVVEVPTPLFPDG